MRGNCPAQTQTQSSSTADPNVGGEECKPSPRSWGARKHLWGREGSEPKKLVQVDLRCGRGAKPRAAISDPSLPTPPPGVLYTRGWRPGAHRHLRALAELCSHHPLACTPGPAAFWGWRSAHSPLVPSPGGAGPREPPRSQSRAHAGPTKLAALSPCPHMLSPSLHPSTLAPPGQHRLP